jgi:hypothetical protein
MRGREQSCAAPPEGARLRVRGVHFREDAVEELSEQFLELVLLREREAGEDAVQRTHLRRGVSEAQLKVGESGRAASAKRALGFSEKRKAREEGLA